MFTNIRLAGTLLICLVFLCLPCPADTHSLPTADDIEKLSKESENVGTVFFRLGWPMCLAHEYKGPFIIAPASDKLKELSKKADDDQQQIIEQQLRLKTIIEEYEADDWDQRYGVTGLWRKLSGQIIESKLNKYLFEYYFALASNEPEKAELLRACLAKLDSLETTDSFVLYILLKAKVLTALSHSDATYKKIAQDFFDKIEKQKDLPSQIVNYLHLEKLRFSPPTNVEHWDRLAEDMISENCSKDLGYVLSFCFLQRRFDPDAFKKTLVSCPNVRQNLETALLANYTAAAQKGLLDKDLLSQTTSFEANLLAEAAHRDNPEQHLHLLKKLGQSENTRTPSVVYVTAKAHIDTDPTEAIRLLLKANKLHNRFSDKNDHFNQKAVAQEAAELAYELLNRDSNTCFIATKAFNNYSQIAGEDIKPHLQYLHTLVLQKCGESNARLELLKKISSEPNHPFTNRARFELAVESTLKKSLKNNIERSQLAKELAAVCYTSKDCKYVVEIMELLSQIIDRIDIYLENEQDPHILLNACKQLSRYCFDCLEDNERYRAGIFLAESVILNAQTHENELPPAEELLAELSAQTSQEDIDLLRCRARLYAAQQKFNEAAEIWKKIANAKKPQTEHPNTERWKWWRAKYYQLYCLSNTAKANNEDVSHTIDVLFNSFSDIPAPWDKKLHKMMENYQKNNYPLP